MRYGAHIIGDGQGKRREKKILFLFLFLLLRRLHFKLRFIGVKLVLFKTASKLLHKSTAHKSQ